MAEQRLLRQRTTKPITTAMLRRSPWYTWGHLRARINLSHLSSYTRACRAPVCNGVNGSNVKRSDGKKSLLYFSPYFLISIVTIVTTVTFLFFQEKFRNGSLQYSYFPSVDLLGWGGI